MKIIVNNLATEYIDKGRGSIILILHGWGSSSAVFEPLINMLDSKARIIALDLPGFGASESPKETWGISDYAWFVTAFCEKLELKPKVIIGHSLGGQIAVNLAGNKLLDPKKIVLIGAAALRPKQNLKKRGIQLAAKTGKVVLGKSSLGQSLRKQLYGAIGSSEYLDSPAMQATYRRVITEDQTAAAKQVTAPTLLVWGINDTETPFDQGQKLHSLIPSSQFRAFPGGHFVFLDTPEANLAIKEFIG